MWLSDTKVGSTPTTSNILGLMAAWRSGENADEVPMESRYQRNVRSKKYHMATALEKDVAYLIGIKAGSNPAAAKISHIKYEIKLI